MPACYPEIRVFESSDMIVFSTNDPSPVLIASRPKGSVEILPYSSSGMSFADIKTGNVFAQVINWAGVVDESGTSWGADFFDTLGALNAFFFDSQIDVVSGKLSIGNSTETPLGIAGTFTGTWEYTIGYSSLILACKTDQIGVIYVDYSTDGITALRSVPYIVAEDLNEVHRLTNERSYFRVRFENTSGVAQTYLSIQTILGQQVALSSPLNSIIQQDADALVTRQTDFNLMVAAGKYQNHKPFSKDGINDDIDASSSPEDIWNPGGIYTGFVTSTETMTLVSTSASDTGTVYFYYLETASSTEYALGSIALNGTTPVTTGFNVWRCNDMFYDNGSTANVGEISAYQTTTTANIFCTIQANYGSSFCSAFTVPAGTTAYVDYFSGGIKGGATAALDGFIYWKEPGKSPLLKYSYTLLSGAINFDDVDYLFSIPESVDIVPRIESTNGSNNIKAQVRYRIILVKN